MSRAIKPPAPILLSDTEIAVFLAGSIMQGAAPQWQNDVEHRILAATENVVVLNPRREKWDPSWPQDPNFIPFAKQVEWELEGLETAHVIAMYFAPETKAPVTMLELGLWAESKKLIVCCPPGYERHGNVWMTCERYGTTMVKTMEEMLSLVLDNIRRLS